MAGLEKYNGLSPYLPADRTEARHTNAKVATSPDTGLEVGDTGSLLLDLLPSLTVENSQSILLEL
jgi:hypothetical protein